MADMHDTTEEYLENILEIEEEGTRVMRARLVERLGLSAAAVSETVGRLADQGFVELADDRTVSLTIKGRELATKIVRRHRLAERLLVDIIGLEWEKVHREADRWEHVISDDVEEKLIALLGDPATCPHGNPIPGTLRDVSAPSKISLAHAPEGRFTVSRISERIEINDEFIALVSRAELTPGKSATLLSSDSSGFAIRSDTGDYTIPNAVADHLYVTVPTR